MSVEGENGKNPQIEKDETDAKSADGVDTDKKAEIADGDTANKVKGDEKDLQNDEKKETKEIDDAKKEDKEDKEKKDVKEDKKEKGKVDKHESDKDDVDDDEEEDDKEEDVDDDEEKEEEKSTPKKRGAQKNAKNEKDANNDDEDDAEGAGTELGAIPRIDASISRFKNEDLKLLHKLLFKSPIKTPLLKKNIRKFCGFNFKKSSSEYEKKISSMGSFEVKQLRIICEMLDLDKKGNREELSERILGFLVEPKDSGKSAGRGRPVRSAAVKANNRGYSSHDDDYSSDERTSPRAKRNMGRRTNLKDETSSDESDEDFKPSDESEEEKPRTKRRRSGRRKKEETEEEDEESEVESEESEESDEGPKGKRKKIANNKPKGRVGAPRGRGRPSLASPAKRKAPARRGRKKEETSEEEEEESEAHEEASSSEDEPLAKKTVKNPQPPTDDEIKSYVKEILEGANLEEITMKTVCKQVYAHYPDFDLTHKKDYIKSTVKSLIST